ncbi:hypothetical protein REPUB_Repub04eG0262900 [Reevesia pubescens]
MAKSGTEKEGGFTEAQLQELRICTLYQGADIEPKKKAASTQRNALASALRLQRKIVRAWMSLADAVKAYAGADGSPDRNRVV